MDLQADSIQGVLFVVPGQHQNDAPKIWENLIGEISPEITQRQPNTPFLASTAAGEVNGKYIAISSQVGSISITVSKRAFAMAGIPQVPQRIPDVLSVIDLLIEWLNIVSNSIQISRVGLYWIYLRMLRPVRRVTA